MSLTKQQLEALNNSSFPDNTSGYITPEILRTYNSSSIAAFVDEIAYNVDSASFNTRIIAATGSGGGNVSVQEEGTILGNATSFNFLGAGVTATLSSGTASVTIPGGGSINTGSLVTTASFNSYTASQDFKNTTFATTSSLTTLSSSIYQTDATQSFQITANALTASNATTALSQSLYFTDTTQSVRINNLTALTGSTAYTNVNNTFNGTQSFDNVVVTGTASVAFLNVTYQSSSVIYSSGSNILGDEANVDTQTLIGRVIMSGSAEVTGSLRVSNNVTITGSLTASGIKYPTTDGTAGQFIITNGTGTLTFDDVHVLLEDVRYGENITIGDPLYVSGSNGNRPVVFKADAASSSKMPVIYIASSTANVNTNTTAITLGLITGVTTTGYAAGTIIYVAEGGGWSQSRPSGSASIVQPLGIVTKEGSGGSGRGLVLNPGPAFLPNIQTGYAWVGNGSNQPVAVTTSSFATNVSGYVTTSSFNSYTASQDFKNTTFATTSSLTDLSASLYFTDTTQSNNIATLTSRTGSYITTGSATTTSQTILGDFKFDTTRTSVNSWQSLVGGSNIIEIPYDQTTEALSYWLNNNFSGVSVTGSGITNGTITGWTYGAGGYDVSITAGTIIYNNFYAFSGPAIQTIDITGSLSITWNIQTSGSTGHTNINQGTALFQNADDSFATQLSPGDIQAQINTGDIIGMTPSASANGGLDGTWLGASIYTAYDGAYRPMFGFETQNTWTDGRITALKPLVISGSLLQTGSTSFSELTGSLASFSSSVNTRIIAAENTGYVTTASFNAFTASQNFKNTTFATTGSNSLTGSQIITGSLTITGSVATQPVALTITSNTASIDFSKGSIYTLTLVSSSVATYVTASNLTPGQTANLVVTQASALSGSIVWASAFKFPSGSSYTGSAVVNAVDLVSFITVNNSTIYSVGAKNLI